MHALEKIIARASGEARVETGQTVNARVDLAEVNDLYLQVLVSFEEMDATQVWDPSKVVFVFDHYAPSPTILAAASQRRMREFVAAHGVKHLFDVNSGICHQVMVESGLVKPGMLVVETDSHTTIMGALGAFGTGCGATDMAAILATGEMWLRVPPIIRVDYAGELPEGIMGKDVALRTLGELGTEVASYKGIEFAGRAVLGMGLSDKMALCNMAVEMGAKTSYMQPTADVLEYVRQRAGEESDPVFTDAVFTDAAFTDPVFTNPVFTDPGYDYAATYEVSLDGMEPQVACPSRVDNVRGVSEVAGEPIDQAVIGTCTGGRLEDIETAARVLAGRQVSPGCRLIVVSASREVLRRAIDAGYVQTLLDAGAVMVSPGCWPCLGAHQGVLAPGERCITSSRRNFPGRMGSASAEIFVASPATVAASAATGRITDPRKCGRQ